MEEFCKADQQVLFSVIAPFPSSGQQFCASREEDHDWADIRFLCRHKVSMQ